MRKFHIRTTFIYLLYKEGSRGLFLYQDHRLDIVPLGSV